MAGKIAKIIWQLLLLHQHSFQMQIVKIPFTFHVSSLITTYRSSSHHINHLPCSGYRISTSSSSSWSVDRAEGSHSSLAGIGYPSDEAEWAGTYPANPPYSRRRHRWTWAPMMIWIEHIGSSNMRERRPGSILGLSRRPLQLVFLTKFGHMELHLHPVGVDDSFLCLRHLLGRFVFGLRDLIIVIHRRIRWPFLFKWYFNVW